VDEWLGGRVTRWMSLCAFVCVEGAGGVCELVIEFANEWLVGRVSGWVRVCVSGGGRVESK